MVPMGKILGIKIFLVKILFPAKFVLKMFKVVKLICVDALIYVNSLLKLNYNFIYIYITRKYLVY